MHSCLRDQKGRVGAIETRLNKAERDINGLFACNLKLMASVTSLVTKVNLANQRILGTEKFVRETMRKRTQGLIN